MDVENKITTTCKEYNITELLKTKIRPTNERFGLWLLRENLNDDNLLTNIGDINYTEGEEKMDSFIKITEPFCDNIMIVKITDSTDLIGNFLTKEACGSFNLYLRNKFSQKFKLSKHGVKAKNPLLYSSNTLTVNGVKQIIEKDIKIIEEKYKNPVIVPYKIELSDISLSVLLEELPEILNQLSIEHYYLLDFDITQDFSGTFNKEEMIHYLCKNYDFCKQGDYYKKDFQKIIVNNNKTVGKDCLTWLSSNYRAKIYNKFICQITSPGVNKKIGNHIIDFIECPDDRLRQTFDTDLVKKHGLTRFEITIYNYENFYNENNNTFDPLKDCIDVLNDNKSYFSMAPIYSVSISNMWKKLCDSLKNSCCIVFDNLLQYVYWGNKNTGKFTGLQIKLKNDNREKIINYVLKACSFNFLPINYINVTEDKNDKNKIIIDQKCYLKSGGTYFSRSFCLFSTIDKSIKLEEKGLISTKNIDPLILRKKTNKNNSLNPFKLIEIDVFPKVFLECEKIRKQELDEINLQKRKKDYEEKQILYIEDIKKKLEKEEIIEERESFIEDKFSKRWIDFPQNGVFKLYAFIVDDKNKFTYVGALAKDKDKNYSVYYVKGHYKNKFIELNKKRELLIKNGFMTIRHYNLDIIYYPSKEPFIELKTDGMQTYNGNSFPRIKYLNLLNIFKDYTEYNKEEKKEIENLTMDYLYGDITVKKCNRLEELEKGLELIVSHIRSTKYRGIDRYFIKFVNNPNIYVSNYWMEKEIKDKKIDFNYRFKIKLEVLKTTTSKNKERFIIITQF